VDEESSELCIGSLENGFDLENARKIEASSVCVSM